MTDRVLRGGRVLGPAGWSEVDLSITDGRIAAHPAAGATPLDVAGLLVAPGLIDLQCNGGLGIDLAGEPERLWELGSMLARWGVTVWLPTIVSSPPGTIDRALDTWRAGPPVGWWGAVPLGLHLEGPFLAPGCRGAHPEQLLVAPSADLAAGWSRDAGVAMVTVAPELPGALDLIAELVDRGIVVSLGHSAADAEVAAAAVGAGARWVTHVFNAMSSLHHRNPGLVGVALTDERLHVGLIADGVHVDPRIVALVHRAVGDRLTLVTDAVGALGMAPGRQPLGRQEVVVSAIDVRLPDGTLAGSNLSLDQAVRNLVAMAGATPAQALAAASAAPAALLGDRTRGRLAEGSRADLLVLTADLEVVATMVGGDLVHVAAGHWNGPLHG